MMKVYYKSPSIFSIQLFVVCFTSIATAILIPHIPEAIISIYPNIHIAQVALYGGYLQFFYYTIMLLSVPLMSWLTQKYGNYLSLMILLYIGLVGFLFLYFNNIYALFIGFFFLGVMGDIYLITFSHISIQAIDTNKKTLMFSSTLIAKALGRIIGPSLGGMLNYSFSINLPIYIATLLIFICIGFVYWTWKHSQVASTQVKSINHSTAWYQLKDYQYIYKNRNLLLYFFVLFIFEISFLSFDTTWFYYTKLKLGWDIRLSSIGFSIVAIGFIIGQLLIVKIWIKYISNSLSAILGLILFGVMFLLIFYIKKFPDMFLIGFMDALSTITLPSLLSCIASYSSVANSYKNQNIIGILFSLSNIIAPLCMTYLFYIGANNKPPILGVQFIVAAMGMFLGSFILILLINKKKV